MLTLCRDLLKPGGFLILTAYAIRASFLSLHRLSEEVLGPGVQSGELALRDESGGLLAHLALLPLDRAMSGTLPRTGTFKQVTSLANPLVKEIRALHQKKHRDETGLFIAEGQKLVRDAVESGWPVEMLAYAAAQAGDAAIGALAAAHQSGGRHGARSLRRRCWRRSRAATTRRASSASSASASRRKTAIGERRHLGGARPGARPRQSRHHHPHRRRGRPFRRGAGRRVLRPVRAGGGARDHGLDLPCAARAHERGRADRAGEAPRRAARRHASHRRGGRLPRGGLSRRR